ncbi:hypothetical protein ACJJIF_03090 [Microbulbifer sp. SSSA002]|uniref:hypothetical protein n=1 Tax=unclassified Microbulbifer TaxID=2619833 RepID=UPI0040390241
MNDKFNKLRKKQIIGSIIFTPALIGIFASLEAMEGGVETFGGLPIVFWMAGCSLAVALYLIFSKFNWRCPGCENYLGKGLSPKFCKSCGFELS